MARKLYRQEYIFMVCVYIYIHKNLIKIDTTIEIDLGDKHLVLYKWETRVIFVKVVEHQYPRVTLTILFCFICKLQYYVGSGVLWKPTKAELRQQWRRSRSCPTTWRLQLLCFWLCSFHSCSPPCFWCFW